MFSRLLQFSKNHSFFLFGPRGTGKSTLLHLAFDPKTTLWLDLLDLEVEEQFLQNPSKLYTMVQALSDSQTHVVIDEIQKIPKLLDEVHRLIEGNKTATKKTFILTGSSARKLKRGGANLLAGRAFVYYLYSLSSFELGTAFDLDQALHFGTLPKIFDLNEAKEKETFLRAYADTYLKEEIWGEQVVRKLDPFRRFLEIAAQCNGTIINVANIARDVGVDDKTVKEYFSILEDTMIGFFLEPFHNSFRKRFVSKPKFYFFDTGIVRCLAKRLSLPLVPKTESYGLAFEHFVILEWIRLASYFQPDFRFSFLRTVTDAEIDLVVERPGKPLLCVEIKSTDSISEHDIKTFYKLTKDMPDCEAVVLSRDRFRQKFDHVMTYPWQEGLMEYFPEIAPKLTQA